MQNLIATISPARKVRRRNILASTVPDRKCPECGEGPLVEGRQWVLLVVTDSGQDIAVCRSCFSLNWTKSELSGTYQREVKESLADIKWFAEVTTFVVDPRALVRARESVGISQIKLAELLGWSRTKLRRLESTAMEISRADRDFIQKVLDR